VAHLSHRVIEELGVRWGRPLRARALKSRRVDKPLLCQNRRPVKYEFWLDLRNHNNRIRIKLTEPQAFCK